MTCEFQGVKHIVHGKWCMANAPHALNDHSRSEGTATHPLMKLHTTLHILTVNFFQLIYYVLQKGKVSTDYSIGRYMCVCVCIALVLECVAMY